MGSVSFGSKNTVLWWSLKLDSTLGAAESWDLKFHKLKVNKDAEMVL
jgi:hypothetical protein